MYFFSCFNMLLLEVQMHWFLENASGIPDFGRPKNKVDKMPFSHSAWLGGKCSPRRISPSCLRNKWKFWGYESLISEKWASSRHPSLHPPGAPKVFCTHKLWCPKRMWRTQESQPPTPKILEFKRRLDTRYRKTPHQTSHSFFAVISLINPNLGQNLCK